MCILLLLHEVVSSINYIVLTDGAIQFKYVLANFPPVGFGNQ